MNIGTLLNELFTDTVGVSLPRFRPELAVVVTIVLLLLCRMLPLLRRVDSGLLALGGVCFATWYAYADFLGLGGLPGDAILASAGGRQEIFGGLLVYDSLTAFLRLILTGFLVLYVLLTKLSAFPTVKMPPILCAVLGSSLGMCLMASANHLLMVFMAVEMASVPSYVLAGMLKGRAASSEAALKYAVYGAGAAGVMLYGISLIAGVLGTLQLPALPGELARVLSAGGTGGSAMVLCLGGLMLTVGLAFKLSAVPFHFWCPDVFEGAAAEVGAFLSVASKAAAVALLVRVAFGFSLPAGGAESTAAATVTAIVDARHFIVYVIGLLAITCTFGNLAAYGQTNMKRLLAYSTIAHAGYLMMAVAAAVAMAAVAPGGARDAISAVAFYLATYLFMNLGAFGIVALLRNQLRSEEIAAYSGLIRTSPGIVVALAVVLVSLIGLPPLSGFVAKFLVFSSLADAIAAGCERPLMLLLLAVGGFNTVISLFYYLRVLKVMTFDPLPEDRVAEPFPLVSISGAMVTGLVVPVVVFGIFWSGLYAAAQLAGAIAS